MKETAFTLEPGHTYIQVDQLLKLLGIAESGGGAHQMIAEGEVKVNGETSSVKRKKLFDGDMVELDGLRITVKNP